MSKLLEDFEIIGHEYPNRLLSVVVAICGISTPITYLVRQNSTGFVQPIRAESEEEVWRLLQNKRVWIAAASAPGQRLEERVHQPSETLSDHSKPPSYADQTVRSRPARSQPEAQDLAPWFGQWH